MKIDLLNIKLSLNSEKSNIAYEIKKECIKISLQFQRFFTEQTKFLLKNKVKLELIRLSYESNRIKLYLTTIHKLENTFPKSDSVITAYPLN